MPQQKSSMDPDFPNWYREASIGHDPDRLERRWSGLAAAVGAAKRSDIEAMIRVAFKTKASAHLQSMAQIVGKFKEADDTFPPAGVDRELEVLCGAALAVLCRGAEPASSTAALAVTTASAIGARKPGVSIDLVAAAESGLRLMGQSTRRRPDLSQPSKSGRPQFSLEKAEAKMREQQNFEGAAAAFGLAGTAVRERFEEMTRQEGVRASAIKQFLTVQDEELQMLWWLVGGHSWEFDRAFSAVPATAQPLVLSKELADLTQVSPGPVSVKGLLTRAGLTRRKVTVPSAVNACDKAWLAKILDSTDPSPVTQPVHFAIGRALETGDDVAWVAGWAAASGLDPVRELPAIELGNHFYRERLLSMFGKE